MINLVVHRSQEAPPEFTSVPSGPQPSITTAPAEPTAESTAQHTSAPEAQPAPAPTTPKNTWLAFNARGEVVAFGNDIDDVVSKAKAAGVQEPLLAKFEPARP